LGFLSHRLQPHRRLRSSPARNEIHQALECRLHGVEIFVDVGVIELDGSQNHRVGKVVQELRSLVEKSRVVLIAFHDEVLASAEMKARAQNFRQCRQLEKTVAVRWSQISMPAWDVVVVLP